MELVEVRKNKFVNRNHVTAVVLLSENRTDNQIYWWRFALVDGGYLNSKSFTSEKDARKWLNRKFLKESEQAVFIWNED